MTGGFGHVRDMQNTQKNNKGLLRKFGNVFSKEKSIVLPGHTQNMGNSLDNHDKGKISQVAKISAFLLLLLAIIFLVMTVF
jgi:hypothetical protein